MQLPEEVKIKKNTHNKGNFFSLGGNRKLSKSDLLLKGKIIILQ
jgi:hypothetical protein